MAALDKGAAPRPVRVALAYPYSVDRRRIASVAVAPPTLDALDTYRALSEPRPADIVAALTDESLYVAGQMRWLDAARVIEAGLDMLPDDIRADFTAALSVAAPDADADAPPAPAPGADADQPGFEPAPPDAPEMSGDVSGVMSEFLHRTDGLMIDG